MKKTIFAALLAGLSAFGSCTEKKIIDAETTPETSPATGMPATTVTDSAGVPISQDTTTKTAAGDGINLGKK